MARARIAGCLRCCQGMHTKMLALAVILALLINSVASSAESSASLDAWTLAPALIDCSSEAQLVACGSIPMSTQDDRAALAACCNAAAPVLLPSSALDDEAEAAAAQRAIVASCQGAPTMMPT